MCERPGAHSSVNPTANEQSDVVRLVRTVWPFSFSLVAGLCAFHSVASIGAGPTSTATVLLVHEDDDDEDDEARHLQCYLFIHCRWDERQLVSRRNQNMMEAQLGIIPGR